MISEQEAQDLMNKLIKLRENAKNNDPEIISELKKHQNICLEKFKYLVTMKTSRYKAFSNYDDLNQEGYLALLKAMKNYNPNKGSFFWWSHKYIDTRISRTANLHTTIRYPLKFAKEYAPHKEATMPLIIEHRFCPDLQLEKSQIIEAISNAIPLLNNLQKEIITLLYGLDGSKPISIKKICDRLQISRPFCIKNVRSSIELIKQNIKL